MPFSTDLTTLIFPPQCASCGTRLLRDGRPGSLTDTDDALPRETEFLALPEPLRRYWCRACWSGLEFGSRPTCSFCAAVLRNTNSVLSGCPLCHRQALKFDQAIAVGGYDGLLRELVVRMKNQRDDSLAIRLGDLLALKQKQSSFLQGVDLVLPVPTHWARRMKRGFCGAELLADCLAKQMQVRCDKHLLRCSRRTQKQGTLSMTARKANVRKAFAVSRRGRLKGQHVLLVDDVMTSGATVSEIARVLKRSGASSVFVAVVARAGVTASGGIS